MKSLTIVFLLLVLIAPALAHEPVFSLGPHTIFQGGIGLESKIEKNGQQLSSHSEVIYGMTQDWAVTMTLPIPIYNLQTTKSNPGGIGDISLRSKYRFFRQAEFGAMNQAAILTGVKVPTGIPSATGSGSTDVLLGLTAGRESIHFYYFGDIRYRLNTPSNQGKNGDVLNYDLSFGLRPWVFEYEEIDPVLLVELNGESQFPSERSGSVDSQSGGHVFSLSPTFLISYRNIMFKGGVQLPFLQFLNGNQPNRAWNAILGVEAHF